MTGSLKEYTEMFERLSLTELEVREGDFKLKMKKESLPGQGPAAAAPSFPEKEPEAEPEKEPESRAGGGYEVKAPLLGVFYGASEDKKAVREGDRVEEGDVLCILEAMKMMNEVKAPVSGTVTGVFAAEGDLVEYDQVLFMIDP